MENLRLNFASLQRWICFFLPLTGALFGSSISIAGGDVEHKLNLGISPPLTFIHKSRDIRFSVIVYKGVEDIVDAVRLVQVDSDGAPLSEVRVMNDEGEDGDRKAGDGEYTATLIVSEPNPVTRYYQAVVNFKNRPTKVFSGIREFQVTEKPYSKEVDEDNMVYGQGSPFPVNRVIVLLGDKEPKSTAEVLAASVEGTVVGYTPSINQYTFEVPSETVEELDAIIDQLETDPRVELAAKSIVPHLE